MADGNNLKEDRLSEILSSILKPLAFASKDGFAHLNSVKGLEPLITGLASVALSIAPEKDHEKFKRLKDLFSGFDALDSNSRKEKVIEAMGLVGPAPVKIIKKHVEAPLEEVRRRLGLLRTPLERIKGIGPKLSERLSGKGLSTVEDLLYFLPFRYEDRRKIKKIRELTPGGNEVAVGEVLAFGEARYGKRKVYEVAIGDGSGILKAKWFHYRLSYMKDRFKNGKKLILFGTVSQFGNQKEMIHPDIEIYDEDEPNEKHFGSIIPIYSQIENFHQKTTRKIITGLAGEYARHAIGGVPFPILERHGLLDMAAAFKEAHMPSDVPDSAGLFELARKSLTFDELFMLEIGLALKRNQVKKEEGIAFDASIGGGLESGLKKILPFKLTDAQEKVLAEIKKDMSAPHPMNRLIQGDVGSGKTIVSFISALMAVGSGYQAAIMAPTEILSEQHFISTHKYAEALHIRTVLLTGGMKKAERTAALEAIKDGRVDLVIGTHALIQKDVDFKKLGLIIVDEQHRFGVVQRAALKKKGFASERGVSPDMLIMTATPIPRTLSMTVFGDLDVSIIDELPPGRKPIHTRVIREKDRAKAYDFIRGELKGGSQCYVVYPLVEESKEVSLKDATGMKEHLQSEIFPEFRLGLLHGRMKSAEKESVMRDFKDKRLDILVSTTVIEVGVDVPNATVMFIEHAERFGLAQLHQLRGRVGRGDKRSVCLLLAEWTNSEDTYRRLKVMEETMDGFRIAEEDLKIRGPGDFIGTRQAGLPDFRIGTAFSDLNLLKKAREEAFNYLLHNPELKGLEGERVREVLKARWVGRLELAEIG